jgi:hypothetical protein
VRWAVQGRRSSPNDHGGEHWLRHAWAGVTSADRDRSTRCARSTPNAALVATTPALWSMSCDSNRAGSFLDARTPRRLAAVLSVVVGIALVAGDPFQGRSTEARPLRDARPAVTLCPGAA